MLLKLGDMGPEVVEVQKLLSLLGYDLIIDGQYGPRTKRSVTAFQKRAGLENTGEVDDDTLNALKLSQTRKSEETAGPRSSAGYDFPVNTQYRLNPNQYIKQVFEKTQIILHYTAGGPSAKNVIDYWNGDEPQIATPFVIDGNSASIYECYNPDYWSYHLGIKGTKGRLDKASIGVEVCAYGPLKEKDGKFYAWPNDYSSVVVPSERICNLERDFRGFHHYEAFTDQQVIALEVLLNFLIPKYNIKIQKSFDFTWFDYNEAVIRNTLPGLWSHTTVRKDKFDLYPDKRVIDMLNRLAAKYHKP
jgi:N-acetyl-anhydromuramyl-L-alanine amidase AmpD